MRKYNVAVVGGTGLVGKEILSILEEREFPIETLRISSSSSSSGTKIYYNGQEYIVEELNDNSFESVNIALFAVDGNISAHYAPLAVRSGCVVIDNSSFWRMDPRCPLLVPEVNPQEALTHKGIIANPNCSTIQLVAVLHPLHKESSIKRVVVSTYQSVSGSGLEAISELEQQVQAIYSMQEIRRKVYPHQIAFNLVPQIDTFVDDDYTKEEHKMMDETRKILTIPHLAITTTTVRVPVFYGHSESVNIEFTQPLSPQDARVILSQTEGIVVIDNPKESMYPMPIDVAGEDAVFVGRIRQDFSVEYGLNLWICADNIRKGAALNAVQIAELLLKESLLQTKYETFKE
ncbi:MAG: aspartate-semialdehyde dehydrogenase [Desulfovibrionaceae bacterium]